MTRVKRKRYDPFVPRLYGVQEAAEYLGISRRNLTAKLARGQIVPPVAELAATPVWSESQLDEQLFFWRDNPMGRWPEDKVRQFTLSRRLRRMEARWERLVRASVDYTDKRRIRAIWEGEEAISRRKGGGSAIATEGEALRALTEAKLLRLVADLRDEDPVFAGIAAELDEAADLRKEIESLQEARRERAIVGEGVEAQA
jgi:hypothetical protein